MSGTLVPVKADDIYAWYDTQRSSLHLHAKGLKQPNIKDIHFRKRPVPNSLEFDLVGRHYFGAMDPLEPYEISDPFPMATPLVDKVFVATSDQPLGKLYPIQIVMLARSEDKPELGSSTNAQEPDASKTLMLDEDDIHVIVDRTFKIVFPSHVDKRGSISIGFDKQFVQLVDAGIRDTNVFWTFKALQPTWDISTDIALYVVPSGLLPSMYRTVHHVYISEMGVPSNEGLFKNQKDGLKEPFIAFVKTGLDAVRQTYPAAQIHRVTANPPIPMKVHSPRQLTKLTLECQIGERILARLHSLSWGVWGPIDFITKPLDDIAPTPWTDHMMDIDEADRLMKEAGFKGAYTAATLEKPVSPTLPSQPYYVFDMVQLLGGPSTVFVGVNDRKVVGEGQAVDPKA